MEEHAFITTNLSNFFNWLNHTNLIIDMHQRHQGRVGLAQNCESKPVK